MSTDKKTEGAWLVHHAQKLQAVSGAIEFQEVEFAGKCGMLLSALAADEESVLSKRKVEAIAKSLGLNVHSDLPAMVGKLVERQIVDSSQSGNVSVLGLTTPAVLTHTAEIFRSTTPTAAENAALFVAEETSRTPALAEQLVELVSDTFRLATPESETLLNRSLEIGFVDSQNLDGQRKLVFNGNIFRVDNAKKIDSVLTSLSAADRNKMSELEELLKTKGCMDEPGARRILGDVLFDKLHSIGVFDVSNVSNESETTFYVTRPGAFGKFGSTIAEDALDLAKALVASLTYGMTRRSPSKGKIRLLNFLLDKLIRGETLNPSTAAGQDYKILELRGVVKVLPARGGMFRMRLLKKEVGRYAKQILNFGDASEERLPMLPGASLTTFKGPEHTRGIKRRKQTDIQKSTTADLLNSIRTGDLR